MQISYTQCKNILDTLPVGYYLGHNVAVTLDETGSNTYMEPEDESITISYPMIAEALQPAPDTCDPEKLIRGLLYHEISHALLTTSALPIIYNLRFNYAQNNYIYKHLHEFVNIMEDERIETVLARYYFNVNFKENIIAINNIADPKKEAANAKTLLDKFYFAVRYHIGPKNILDNIQKCITCYAFLANNVPNMPASNRIDLNSVKVNQWHEYIQYIIAIALQFKSDTAEQNDTGSENKTGTEQNDTGSETKINQSTSANSPADQKPQNDLQQSYDAFIDQVLGKLTAQGWSAAKVKSLFKDLSTNKESLAIEARLNHIINIATKKHAQSSGASAAYCGKIDPRLCQNKDYKWWLKKSDSDTNKRYSKVHFNLFCDNSASFILSQSKMNGLLLALKHLEEDNKNFSFDVVHLGVGDQYKSKKDMYLTTDDGSRFENTIFDTYKKLQLPNVTNLNIVVIDGRMSSYDKNGFTAFNHENCIIVTDTDNQTYIKACPKAKCTLLEDDYADVFIDTVLNKIQACLA